MSINWSAKVKNRDNWTCQECGVTAEEIGTKLIHAHHIKPKSLGGENTLENGVTVCKPCHVTVYHNKVLRPYSKPNGKKKIIVVVTSDMKKALRQAMKDSERTQSGIFNLAIREFLNKNNYSDEKGE